MPSDSSVSYRWCRVSLSISAWRRFLRIRRVITSEILPRRTSPRPGELILPCTSNSNGFFSGLPLSVVEPGLSLTSSFLTKAIWAFLSGVFSPSAFSGEEGSGPDEQTSSSSLRGVMKESLGGKVGNDLAGDGGENKNGWDGGSGAEGLTGESKILYGPTGCPR